MPTEPTRWTRLEPVSRDRELNPGLEARIHDPLWLLGRQWQFGEFLAADGGSAIVAQITASVAPLTKLRPGRPGSAARTGNYVVSSVPLETLVEAEDIHAARSARARVRAGQHFERVLTAHKLERHIPAYRTTYPVAAMPGAPDAASRRFLTIVSGRAIDGEMLYKDLVVSLRLSPPSLPAQPAIPAEDIDAMRDAAQAYVAWANSLFLTLSGGPAAWVPDRLEYAFAVASSDGLTLDAEEYTDGQLDWHEFNVSADAATPPPGRTTLPPVTVVPTAVTYAGMPASRLWEFEDSRVDFGAIDAQPEDLGRMLLAGFALVYGVNWLIAPLEVPIGAIVRITSFDVRDTFGHTTTVGPTAPGGEWGMFGVSRAEGPPESALLVAPALGASLQGRDLEEVLLLRDEVANLAWAIERSVEGEHGLPADLAQAAREGSPPIAPPPPRSSETLPYRLRTDPPPYWYPLMPQREDPTDPSMTFRLGALPRVTATGPAAPLHPRGLLLRPMVKDPRLTVREDEVPREGARVTRAYQLARWIDGTTHLWLGRRKAVGRGEGSSGLRFDTTESD